VSVYPEKCPKRSGQARPTPPWCHFYRPHDHEHSLFSLFSHPGRLPSPTPPSLFHPGDVRILVHLKTPKAPKPHKCFLFSLLCFLCLFYERSCQSSPTLVRFRKEKARQLPKSDWWLRNNGTPCAILTASRTPDILVVVILCSFYSSDQGCFH